MGNDDQAMIEYTVIRYHDHLLTPFEREVWFAFLARRKAQAYRRPEVERRARERWGNLGDARIDAILERGYEEFSRKVTERVMREHGSQVVLNRCPKCGRVVQTPKAKQCLWCHHDWH
jgi:hypothetical protein